MIQASGQIFSTSSLSDISGRPPTNPLQHAIFDAVPVPAAHVAAAADVLALLLLPLLILLLLLLLLLSLTLKNK